MHKSAAIVESTQGISARYLCSSFGQFLNHSTEIIWLSECLYQLRGCELLAGFCRLRHKVAFYLKFLMLSLNLYEIALCVRVVVVVVIYRIAERFVLLLFAVHVRDVAFLYLQFQCAVRCRAFVSWLQLFALLFAFAPLQVRGAVVLC